MGSSGHAVLSQAVWPFIFRFLHEYAWLTWSTDTSHDTASRSLMSACAWCSGFFCVCRAEHVRFKSKEKSVCNVRGANGFSALLQIHSMSFCQAQQRNQPVVIGFEPPLLSTHHLSHDLSKGLRFQKKNCSGPPFFLKIYI